MSENDPKEGDQLDELEGMLDRFLERRLFGAVGPRHRSIALIAALALGAYAAARKCPEASPAAAASTMAVAAPSSTPTPWTVPGLR